MELRSGQRVQSGYATAEAARAACMGAARVQLAPEQYGSFAAAVRGVMLRWTALRLAVENGWAGDDDSDARAAELEQSILAWFHAKGAQPPSYVQRRLALTLASAQASTTRTN